MGTIRLMHAKLHRVRVTEANVNYVGSITVDPILLDMVGILPLEEVDIINLNNGHRFSTYVIPGETGKGEICPNGGAALLCQPGDLLIIYAYEECDRAYVLEHGHQAKVLVADELNQTQEFLLQTLVPCEDGKKVTFHNISIPEKPKA
ncbi:aspartate 1-decarboxylase [Crocosphaera sp. XPORK-15E]|uniref:aspartate 1-decarboxylase n=1 Tax=Crocosphaera sp. XPORK-15E TaxID=3110247 RepID=UPI002B1FE349|nr:aspartate 1-decarboxylase [Crocosphaera sp. XPORK-15E]MEA5533702.1 aspartate 1-decarboxylase [Crocosphaera sp. XPORK-15E]